eukprot:9476801-Pyramimonas_sp.AAC.1
MSNGFACSWLTLILNELPTVIAVNHGHRSSDGTCIVSISLKSALAGRAGGLPDLCGPPDDPGEPDDDDNDRGGGPRRGLRRSAGAG